MNRYMNRVESQAAGHCSGPTAAVGTEGGTNSGCPGWHTSSLEKSLGPEVLRERLGGTWLRLEVTMLTAAVEVTMLWEREEGPLGGSTRPRGGKPACLSVLEPVPVVSVQILILQLECWERNY